MIPAVLGLALYGLRIYESGNDLVHLIPSVFAVLSFIMMLSGLLERAIWKAMHGDEAGDEVLPMRQLGAMQLG